LIGFPNLALPKDFDCWGDFRNSDHVCGSQTLRRGEVIESQSNILL
jgi:hypothetical protein